MEKIYKTEKEGQIDFFNNYGIPWQENNGVLVENCDGVYNGVLFEFKLNINDLNKTLFQAIKYLSRMRVHGESVPATILLVSLNNKTAYEYKSQDYFDEIHKIYTGAASKNNDGFCAKTKAVWPGFNDLATINPKLAAQWHPTKNGDLKPTQVTANSGYKVWWLLHYDIPNDYFIESLKGKSKNLECQFIKP